MNFIKTCKLCTSSYIRLFATEARNEMQRIKNIQDTFTTNTFTSK